MLFLISHLFILKLFIYYSLFYYNYLDVQAILTHLIKYEIILIIGLSFFLEHHERGCLSWLVVRWVLYKYLAENDLKCDHSN